MRLSRQRKMKKTDDKIKMFQRNDRKAIKGFCGKKDEKLFSRSKKMESIKETLLRDLSTPVNLCTSLLASDCFSLENDDCVVSAVFVCVWVFICICVEDSTELSNKF